MSKARVAFAVIVLILCSCKKEAPPPTDTTATTATTSTTATAPPPAPQQFPLDHYKFWKVKAQSDKPLNQTVTLQGQFDRQRPWKAMVKTAQYIANPVQKRRQDFPEQPIQKAELHYIAYSIKPDPDSPPAAAPPVLVTNQFGTKIPFKLGQPAWLLVPASKQLEGTPGEPPKGDHFVCYAAEGPQAQLPITLQDQFDKKMNNRVEEVRDFLPAYFCVPVTKRREGRPPEDIHDPVTHLAIYSLTPRVSFSKPVRTNDQFGRQQLNVTESEFLGVPSRKDIARP